MRSSPTVEKIVDLYLANLARRVRSDGMSKEVAERYVSDLAPYLQMFGLQLVSECRQSDLTELMVANPGWKSINTLRTRMTPILACFRWAADEELIAVCPYKSPKQLRGKTAETRRPATREEFEALMDVASVPLRRALLFLFLSGCRTCEMRELIWEDVRIDGPDQPHLHLVKHKNRRRTGRPRIVGLDGQTVDLLREIKASTNSDHVFVNCDGFPWRKDSFCHNVRRTARRAGLDDGVAERVSAYCLRHTYACDGIEAGYTEDQIAHQLGNSPEIVRRVYSRKLGQKVGFVSGVAVGIGEKRGKV